MTRILRLLIIGLACQIGASAAPALAQEPASSSPATVAPAAPAAQAPDPAAAPTPVARRRARPAAAPEAPAATISPEGATVIDTTDSLDPCDGIRRNPAFRLGQDQRIERDEVIDDFAAVLGNVVVEGHVCGDLSVTLGDVRLGRDAVVDGTLVVVGGTATIEPGASVGRQLVLVGGTLDAPADFHPGHDQVVIGIPVLGARVRAAVPYLTRGLLLGRLIVPDLWWVWAVVGVLLFVQLITNLLFPQAVATAAGVIAERPVSTFLAGVLVIVLTSPVATLLAVTVIGLAALPVLVGGLVIGWIVGRIAVHRWIGARLYPQDDADSRLEGTRSLLIGFVVLAIAYMIPLLGVVVWGLTGVLGLGAAALAFVRAFRRENPPAPKAARPVPPVAPPAVPPAAPAMPLDAATLAAAPALAGAPAFDVPLSRASVTNDYGGPSPAFAGDVPPLPTPPVAAPDARALLAYPRASFMERAAAFALDVLVVGITLAMFGVDEPGDVLLPAVVMYHVAFWTWKATTLGGIVCQLRVVRIDGAPLRFVDALVRGLVGIFSVTVFGLGALWILRDELRQAWHDKVAGTLVVRVPREYPLP